MAKFIQLKYLQRKLPTIKSIPMNSLLSLSLKTELDLNRITKNYYYGFDLIIFLISKCPLKNFQRGI